LAAGLVNDCGSDGKAQRANVAKVALVTGSTYGEASGLVRVGQARRACAALREAMDVGQMGFVSAKAMMWEARLLNPIDQVTVFEAVLADPAAVNSSMVRHITRQLIELLFADQADSRHRKAMKERRVVLQPASDGMAWLKGHLSADQATAIKQGLHQQAFSAVGQGRSLANTEADLFASYLLEGVAGLGAVGAVLAPNVSKAKTDLTSEKMGGPVDSGTAGSTTQLGTSPMTKVAAKPPARRTDRTQTLSKAPLKEGLLPTRSTRLLVMAKESDIEAVAASLPNQTDSSSPLVTVNPATTRLLVQFDPIKMGQPPGGKEGFGLRSVSKASTGPPIGVLSNNGPGQKIQFSTGPPLGARLNNQPDSAIKPHTGLPSNEKDCHGLSGPVPEMGGPQGVMANNDSHLRRGCGEGLIVGSRLPVTGQSLAELALLAPRQAMVIDAVSGRLITLGLRPSAPGSQPAVPKVTWQWQDPTTWPAESSSGGAYHPSDWLALLVMVRDQTCRWPGCDQPATICQVDHHQPYRSFQPAVGQTRADNLGCLCVLHHQIKHSDNWITRRDPSTGSTTWTHPDGQILITPCARLI